MVVATHDGRMLSLTNRVIELVSAASSTNLPSETVYVKDGAVLFT